MLRIREQGFSPAIYLNKKEKEAHMKKKYKKPEIKKVELKPEEAVLTKCKRKQDATCKGVAKSAWS